MKNTFYFFLLFILFSFFTTITVYSQVSLNQYAGLGINNQKGVHFSDTHGYEFDWEGGVYHAPCIFFNTGLETLLPISKKKELIICIEYTYKSSKYNYDLENKHYTEKYHYIRLPIMIRSIRERNFRGNFLIVPNIFLSSNIKTFNNGYYIRGIKPFNLGIQYMFEYKLTDKTNTTLHLETDITTITKSNETSTFHYFNYSAYFTVNYNIWRNKRNSGK